MNVSRNAGLEPRSECSDSEILPRTTASSRFLVAVCCMVACLLPGVARSQGSESVTLEQLSNGQARFVDLGHSLNAQNAYWPGDDYVPFQLKTIATIEKDGVLSKLMTLPEHLGTHLDAPNHFVEGQPSVDRLTPEQLNGPGVVIDVEPAVEADPDFLLSAEYIRTWESEHGAIPDGAIVFLHTGWGKYWSNYTRYKNADVRGKLHFPGFSKEAAEYLVEKRKVRGIGIDTLSIDRGISTEFEVHKVVNGAGRYGLENVAELDRLPARGFHVIVAPMKIENGSGGPARITAILPAASKSIEP